MSTSLDTVFAPAFGLPNTLFHNARACAARFIDKVAGTDTGHWFERQLGDTAFVAQLVRVWGASPFVFQNCLDFPDLFRELWQSGDLAAGYAEEQYHHKLAVILATATTEQELHRELRRFRRREMLRLVWRDFTRQAATMETTGDVTRLAEACIQQSLEFLHQQLCTQFGTPIGKYSAEPQHLLVLGMGKMGGWELNLSSDIDLIFVFPEAGQTSGGRRELSNQEFFIKLGQKLIQSLDQHTVDGFVFRVDMRLRPYGQSGALAINFDAMEEYLQTQGRDWERYAMIKARVVAGQPQAAKELMAILRPFTYRKYIDFSAIQSLRDMKAMINREVARMGGSADIKKSAGGIREVEFIAQAFQLIRGGKDHRFQTQSLQRILELLDQESLLPAGKGAALWQSYLFLRDVEHALQGYKDQQTQTLPDSDEARICIAGIMGFADWDSFAAELAQRRAVVSEVFAGIASEPVQAEEENPLILSARAAWLSADSAADLAADLVELGFGDGAGAIADKILALRNSKTVKAMASGVRDRLDTFMPMLIAACAAHARGAETLERILALVQSILRRSAYLVLLIENPQALRQLVELCANSLWIAEQIGRYPALLDTLLDPRALFTPSDKNAMAQELRQLLLRIPEEDLEAQMETLRYFRRAHGLRVAACEVMGVLPLMKSSDNLTWLAEVILDQVLAMAWSWMRSRYGNPGKPTPADIDPGLLVVGYGKLGGIELGHGSDLDLVFLHNADLNGYSDGEKSIDNGTYFSRLGQRMIHILTTQTASGSVYEVDMRLRPNGNSGMLVTTLTAFEKYQCNDAWIWEHQALVRARAVAGDEPIAGQFDRIRKQVLCAPRERGTLRQAVVEMREKMRAHLGSKPGRDNSQPVFNIKQDAGGIVDIEFTVQYLVLLHGRDHPELVTYTDNMRTLDGIARAGLLPPESVAQLQGAYIFFRTVGHRLNQQGLANRIESGHGDWERATLCREQVIAIWQQVFS